MAQFLQKWPKKRLQQFLRKKLLFQDGQIFRKVAQKVTKAVFILASLVRKFAVNFCSKVAQSGRTANIESGGRSVDQQHGKK